MLNMIATMTQSVHILAWSLTTGLTIKGTPKTDQGFARKQNDMMTTTGASITSTTGRSPNAATTARMINERLFYYDYCSTKQKLLFLLGTGVSVSSVEP